jgi:peptidoglycan-associated lipoprotein
MMLTRRIAVLTIATLSVAMLDACKKKPEPAPIPAAAPPRGDDGAAERARADSIARANALAAAQRRRQDSIDAANRDRDNMTRDAATLRATLTATVHFEYDQSDLRADDKSVLDAKIPILQANTGVMIRVSGHTDERGSDEYNLALGQRRAAAAKAYLVQHGIAESRIETISYGEERPSAQGSDEGAFAQNRRAEFEITAGGQTLRKP